MQTQCDADMDGTGPALRGPSEPRPELSRSALVAESVPPGQEAVSRVLVSMVMVSTTRTVSAAGMDGTEQRCMGARLVGGRQERRRASQVEPLLLVQGGPCMQAARPR